jgi:hypothetical protein
LVEDAIKLWEALRPKDITDEERSKLVSAIMGKVSKYVKTSGLQVAAAE